MALKLERLGVERVRPLLGGIEAWRAFRLPVTSLSAAAVRER